MNRSIPPDVAEDTFQNSGGPDKLMPSFLGRSHSISSQSSIGLSSVLKNNDVPSWLMPSPFHGFGFESYYEEKLDTGNWFGSNATDNTSPAAGDDAAAPVGRFTEAEELANDITSVWQGSFDCFYSMRRLSNVASTGDTDSTAATVPFSPNYRHTDLTAAAVPFSPGYRPPTEKTCFSAISSIDPLVQSVDPLDSFNPMRLSRNNVDVNSTTVGDNDSYAAAEPIHPSPYRHHPTGRRAPFHPTEKKTSLGDTDNHTAAPAVPFLSPLSTEKTSYDDSTDNDLLHPAPMSTGIIHTDPATAVPLSPSPHTVEKSARLAGAGTDPLRVTGFGPSGTARVTPLARTYNKPSVCGDRTHTSLTFLRDPSDPDEKASAGIEAPEITTSSSFSEVMKLLEMPDLSLAARTSEENDSLSSSEGGNPSIPATASKRSSSGGGSSSSEGKKKRKRVRKKHEPEMKEYVQYTDDDVLLGRGGKSNNHPGNRRYLQEKKGLQQVYRRASHSEKSRISRRLVQIVQNWGGRFLERDMNGWFEVHHKTAQKKASQALRENYTPELGLEKRMRYHHK